MKISRGLRTPMAPVAGVALTAALLLVAAAAYGGQSRSPLAGAGAPGGDPGCSQPAHMNVTATVNYSNGTVSVNPDPVSVPSCTIAQITWAPGDNVSGVTGVRGCKSNWPVTHGNPAPPGHIMLVDSNVNQASRGSWAYEVSVTDEHGKTHPSPACTADPPPIIHNG